MVTEQYDKAEKDYREVLRLMPTDQVALRLIYFDQGQLIQAYPLLKQAAELQPEELELQLKFGQAALALRQLAQARDLAQQVLDKKPGDETALFLLVDTAVAPDEIKETQRCGRTPCPHRLRFMQPRALGRKVSDEFTVPLCRGHHRAVHGVGDERAWWQEIGTDPVTTAASLWEQTRLPRQRRQRVAK